MSNWERGGGPASVSRHWRRQRWDRIAWLRENTPGAAAVRHTPELIGAHLTGGPVATDSSHALKSGYDALTGQWPDEVFDAFGVPPGWLPEVVAPMSVLGEVGCGAEVTGLAVGCLVVAGMTDGCASQLAAGACEPGQRQARRTTRSTMRVTGRTFPEK